MSPTCSDRVPRHDSNSSVTTGVTRVVAGTAQAEALAKDVSEAHAGASPVPHLSECAGCDYDQPTGRGAGTSNQSSSLPAVEHALQVPAAYYAVLGGIVVTYGISWEDLMRALEKHDWVTLPPQRAGGALQFWQVYDGLYKIFPWDETRVAWGALLRQVPIAFALFSVVLFGSCLDITAIQASLPYEVRSCMHLLAMLVLPYSQRELRMLCAAPPGLHSVVRKLVSHSS
jgi:hypothetical protein